MKKNKILIGVISIMFAGIITLGIIECNNSNTKDNNKLFIGNGKFCQAKRLNGLGAIYDDDYIFFDCENQIYESYNYSNKKNDKKLNVNCRNSACSHSNDTCEAYVELGEYFVFIIKYTNIITKVKLYQVKIGCMVLLLRKNQEKRSLKILFQLICHQN